MFKGSIPALVTPFTQEGEVDWDALERLLYYQLTSASNGIVLMGTTAEAPVLSQIERQRIVECAKAIVGTHMPIIVGTGSNNTAATVLQTYMAKQWGADAALIVTPYYNRPPQTGLLAHFQACSEVALPQIIYNVPSRTGCDLLPETLMQCTHLPNVVAIKDATGDLVRLQAMQTLSPDFCYLSGDDASALAFMQQGGHGVISVMANVAAPMMRLMCEQASEDEQAAKQIASRLAPLCDFLSIEVNPLPVKEVLTALGYIQPYFRLPLVRCSATNQALCQTLVQSHDYLKESVC